MNAMENASKNAKEMVGKLTLLVKLFDKINILY
jgi:F0F1-type ATP synthase gamma subunit